jgi:nitrogen regulatory protein P-II 1
MKKIEAVIRKSKFDEVKEALHKIEVNFFTYWDVTGWVMKRRTCIQRNNSTTDIQRRYISIVVSDLFFGKND